MKKDIIFYETLPNEEEYLEHEIRKALNGNHLPTDLAYGFTELTAQEYHKNIENEVPRLLSVKIGSVVDGIDAEAIILRTTGFDRFSHLTKFPITHLRQYCVEAVTQQTVAMVFSLARLIPIQVKKSMEFDRKDIKGIELGKNVKAVVFGVGSIGKNIHDLLKNIGLDVYGVDKFENKEDVRYISKEEGIRTADIIIVGMNLMKDNESYFNKEALADAKKCIFVNTMRGELAYSSELLELYKQGKFFGLGLDVFAKEAELQKHLSGEALDDPEVIAGAELIRMANTGDHNIITTPHNAYDTDESVRKRAEETIKHLVHFEKNKKFEYLIPSQS